MDLLKTLPHVREVRGQGLLVGVEFEDGISSVEIKHACFERKLLLTAIETNIIRMVPPLIVTAKDCKKAFEIIEDAVQEVYPARMLGKPTAA